MQKYPAQRVDIYPKKLKMALERGVMYGYLERVRGVGMCGLYRLPGEPTKEEKDDKKDKLKAEDAENGEKEDGEKSGEADTTDDDEQTTKDTSAAESGGEKVKEESDGSADKKKKKKKNRKLDEKWLSKAARHSAPKTVEDALPLAITYQTDPKESSGLRIKRYIDKFYNTDINPDKLKRALDNGVDKGLWEKTKGMGLNGTYHLLIESFNPSHSEDIQDQIAQALVANTVPKQASASLIKKYITQYHPKLNIENRPKLYRNALEKACTKGIIRQLSGIGAVGSFQLLQNFVPSPTILAGESEDEEEDDSDSDDEPEYVPRQTKRGRAAATKPRAKSATSAPARKAPIKRSSSASSAKAKKGGKQIKKEPEANNVGSVEYTPKPTKSRGGGKADKSVPKAAAKTTTKSAKSKKPTPAKPAKKQDSAPKNDNKRSKRISYAEESDEEEEEERYIPSPSRSRGVNSPVESGGSASASKQSSSKSRQAGKRKSMDEPVEEEVAPSPSKKKVKEETDVTPPKKAAPTKEKGKKRQR